MGETFKLLGISGSLRANSFSKALLDWVEELARPRAGFAQCALGELPLYNQDNDPTYGGDVAAPAAVTSLRDAIAGCDGIVIVSPEYNYSVPGVLKNAIDWASRPGYRSPLKDKPVLVISNSPGIIGGVRLHQHLRDILASTLSRVVVRPEIVVTAVREKLETRDAATEAFLKEGLDDLIAEIIRTGVPK